MVKDNQIHWLKWLRPGYHVKRWVFVIVGCASLLSYGLSSFFRNYFQRAKSMPEMLANVTLQFLPYPYRDIFLISIGLIGLAIGLRLLAIGLVSPFRSHNKKNSLMDALYQHQRMRRGPSIVVLGGENGLINLAGALKNVTDSLTVVFNVPTESEKDVYSSIYKHATNCLLALSNAETRVSDVQFDPIMSGVESGWQFGNELLDTMTRLFGSLEEGLQATWKILSVEGHVYPSFSPELPKGISVPEGKERYSFTEVIRALLDADLIVVAPGNWQLDVEPILDVYPLDRAMRMSSAIKIIVDDGNKWKTPPKNLDWVDYVISNDLEEGVPRPTKFGRKKPISLAVNWDEANMAELVLIIMRIYEPWVKLGARFRTNN